MIFLATFALLMLGVITYAYLFRGARPLLRRTKPPSFVFRIIEDRCLQIIATNPNDFNIVVR